MYERRTDLTGIEVSDRSFADEKAIYDFRLRNWKGGQS